LQVHGTTANRMPANELIRTRNAQDEQESQYHDGYAIPSFLDILLQSEFRILHEPPPLQSHETQDDRDYVDFLLQAFWDPAVSRSFLNHHDQDGVDGDEYTYGEITSTGARQLLEDMELLSLLDDKDKEHVVFYDWGSGEGKLVVQVWLELESGVDKIVGIEMNPGRHAMALHAWSQLQDHLQLHGDDDDDDDDNDGDKATIIETSQAMQEAKQRLRTKRKILPDSHDSSTTPTTTNTIPTPTTSRVHWIQGDVSTCDFSDATHIFASSMFFSSTVLESLTDQILHHAQRYPGQLKMVAALSDLELPDWNMRQQRLQMTWGGATVRLYSPKDH
jgi:Histone methylation protein DOT1